MPTRSRPLTSAEKYYAFLDRTWPMNLMLVAELGRTMSTDHVEARWREFSAQRVLPRMRVTPDLALIDGGASAVDFRARKLGTGGLHAELARESVIRYDLDCGVRCRHWILPGESRSFVCLIGHHSIVDARGGVAELRQFVRFLAGQKVRPQRQLSVPAAGAEPSWRTDRSALLALLRDLGARNAECGPPAPGTWPSAGESRRPRFQTLVLGIDETSDFVQAAHAHASRPFPGLAAGAMIAVAAEACALEGALLQLNVPVDLAPDRARVDRPVAVNVGVISQRQRVRTGDPWALARQVGTRLTESLARGEGELFFHLARVAQVDDLAAGTTLVADGVSAAPPAVSVTNLGVIDSEGDPDWLQGLFAYQAPTPNQIVSTLGLGYRGRSFTTISTDDERLGQERALQVVDRYSLELRTMAGRQRGPHGAR